MFKRFSADQSGFTLMELLIAVAIVVILAGVGIPIYLKFQAGAKHSEANTNLNGIKLSEEGYRLANGTYIDCTQHPTGTPDENAKVWGTGNANFNSIGFTTSADVRFVYEVIDSTTTAFVALAHGDTDGDGDTVHFLASAATGPHPYNGETLTAAPSVTIDATPDAD